MSLPPLPNQDYSPGATWVYSAEQMQAYAAAAVAAERESIKARLLDMGDAVKHLHNYYHHAAFVLFGAE